MKIIIIKLRTLESFMTVTVVSGSVPEVVSAAAAELCPCPMSPRRRTWTWTWTNDRRERAFRKTVSWILTH